VARAGYTPTGQMMHRALSRLGRGSQELATGALTMSGLDLAPPDRQMDHAARRNRRLRRSIFARPNIECLRIFRRLMCPATGP
jgi:hypothetical protein